jgi:oxygen-independent coproporphyrinogen III oxidase
MVLSRKYIDRLDEPTAAYLHVPFCHQRCPYCNFTLVANHLDWVDRYLLAIESELSQLQHPRHVDTLFIGGGTPTLLEESSLLRLFESMRRWLPLNVGGEWTIEANPSDLTASKCRMLASQGVNRISIGGQSFDAIKLKTLGRDHDGNGLRQAIEIAIDYFPSVSVDLIFGVPGETLSVWQQDLETALDSGVLHLSTYGLTYEKGAAFWGQLQRGQIRAMTEEDELAMYFEAIERITEAGMMHYEVSNFAYPNYACKHNETYWAAQPWWAFGPGAASFFDGVRRINHRSTSKYLQRMEAKQSPIAESEAIEWDQWTRERFVFGMRKIAGVDWHELTRVGESTSVVAIRKVVDRHIDAGWFVEDGNHVKLTRDGLAISDGLWPEYF